MLILIKLLLAAARNDVAFVESVFPFKEKKPHFTVLHWNLFTSSLEGKMLQQKFTVNWCRCSRPFFYLLPCQSLSLSLLLLQSTKRSAFSLRFHEHDDDLVDEVEDVEDTFEQPLDVQIRFRSRIQSSIIIVGSRF